MYGMWQSAHATPERAWIPWLNVSNSGCCALSICVPVSLWTQSLNPSSSYQAMISSAFRPLFQDRKVSVG